MNQASGIRDCAQEYENFGLQDLWVFHAAVHIRAAYGLVPGRSSVDIEPAYKWANACNRLLPVIRAMDS